jgi:tol-pal system protein YbgF
MTEMRVGSLAILALLLLGCSAKRTQPTDPTDDLAARIARLEARVQTLEGNATANEQPPPAAKTHTPSEQPPPAPSEPVTQPSKGAHPTLYQRAHLELENGNPETALRLFEQVQREDPAGPLNANALYWVGECHYDMGNFNQAVLTFQELAQRFPTSSKTPDALLKLGRSRQKLGQHEEAREEYQRVLERYPSSTAAGHAKRWLAELQEP